MAEALTERLRRCNPTTGTCVDAADLIEAAYGLLWRDTSTKPGSPASEARKLLLAALDKSGQQRGIAAGRDAFGPVSDAEALRNFP